MKRLALTIASCMLLATAAACNGGFYFGKQEQNEYTLISQEEAKKIIDSEQGIVIVQHTRFIGGRELPACLLIVGGVAAASAFGLSVIRGVQSFLPQQF